ncbi:MAG: secretin and TonB N-terminal domain-containing protein [Agriterribacter sp.]
MKLTVLLIIAGFCANAEGLAQKVTLSLNNASLEQVFSQVKLQTGFSFIWDEATLKGSHPVNINVKNAPVSEVMDRCLKDQSLVYQIVGKIIVIRQEAEIVPSVENILKAIPPPVDISGRVTNSRKEPLEGVSVTVKGTQTGTTSNADGRFRLSVPSANVELVFLLWDIQHKR